MTTSSSPVNWSYPTQIRIGAGRISELAEACKSLQISHPLLVTDPRLAQLPIVSNVLTINKSMDIHTGLFTGLKPNPVSSDVAAGVKVFLAGKHDGIIAMGGGSAMDVGKLIAFMAKQSRPILDFEDIGDYWTRANPNVIAPIIAVPTTSGTGSEVGRAGVVTDEDKCTKKIIFHPKMMPGVVICDPELVVGLPPNLTAWTGMDALVHCLEAYCANSYHPIADGIALEGLSLIHKWLPRAVVDGADLESRTHMMTAAIMGATAFQKGLGAIHALSHPIGAIYDTHHGMTNAVFTPYVLMFNKNAVEERLSNIARYLALPSPSFTGVFDWILDLREQFQIPHNASELGIEFERIDEIASMAAADPTASTNPIPVNATKIRSIYAAALNGLL